MVCETRGGAGGLPGSGPGRGDLFGQNMTSLTLHVSRSLARELSAGDEIVVTRLDHDANISPWLLAARDRGCTVRWVDFDPAGLHVERGRARAPGDQADQDRRRGLCLQRHRHGQPGGGGRTHRPRCRRAGASWTRCTLRRTGPLTSRRSAATSWCAPPTSSSDRTRASSGAGTTCWTGLPPTRCGPRRCAAPQWETGTQSFEAIAGVRGAIEYLEWVGRTFGTAAAAAARRPLRAAMASHPGIRDRSQPRHARGALVGPRPDASTASPTPGWTSACPPTRSR